MSSYSLSFAKKLASLGERQGSVATKTAVLIKHELKKFDVPFSVLSFKTDIPEIQKAILTVNGKKIRCLGSSFVSGKITEKDLLLSSLIPSRLNIKTPNINFNPKAQNVSRSNFYFAPALAINKSDLSKFREDTRFKGEVRVKCTRCTSQQILVGNRRNPRTIVFSHYDSLGPGAIDNASGTAVALQVILDNPRTLEQVLFVFDGNEELSYDNPTYWGHGYRVFEKCFFNILIRVQKIIVVDSIGNGAPKLIADKRILNLAFPIKSQKIISKTSTIVGDISKLMQVYHSEDDTPVNLKKKFLDQTVALLAKII